MSLRSSLPLVWADRHRLLPHVQMHETGKLRVAIEFLHLELKQSEFEHFLVIIEEQAKITLFTDRSLRHLRTSHDYRAKGNEMGVR